MGVRQAREYTKLERGAEALRPAEALPRKLQAVMQELLTVNERYHELLQASFSQSQELDAARDELAKLRPVVATLEAKNNAQSEALHRAESGAKDVRDAHELLSARCKAVEAERDDLHKVVQAYAQRLLQAEEQLGTLNEKNAEAEAWLATHWQAGYEEGVAQQKREVQGKLRRVQEKAHAQASAAFERGREEVAAQAASRASREEAERALLLHRAEAARKEQKTLAQQLEAERVAREAAEGKARHVSARLAGVRHQKASLASELHSSRAAHSADLHHFDQMENALGLACAEYSSLAVRHAQCATAPAIGVAGGAGPGGGPSSPPRASSSAADDGDGAHGFGRSPVDAMRTARPVPAA